MAFFRRFLPLLLCAGVLVNCETSGGGIIGGGGGGAPSGSQRTELMLSMEDETEAITASLTLIGLGFPPGFTPPAGCPTATGGSATDTDGDGIPNDRTFTYTSPPCTFAGVRGGTYDITGQRQIRDTTTDTTSFNLTYTDLAWTGTDPAATRTFTATRNGTRTRTGTDSSVTLATSLTIARQRPGRATATIDLLTTATFTADSDTVKIGLPLPGGAIVISGSLQWQRSTENWSLAVGTPVPLHFDPACTTTPQQVDSGTVTLTGTVSGAAGVLAIKWDGCGADPTATWTGTP